MNPLTDNRTAFNNILAPIGAQKRRREAIGEINTNIPDNDRESKKGRTNRLLRFTNQQGGKEDRLPTPASKKRKHVHDFDVKRAQELRGLYMPEEYVETIMESMHKDAPNEPTVDYFEHVQDDIKPCMRTILFGWLTEVVSKFEMKEIVLWKTFQLLDQYLSCTSINRERFQLLGCAALWVASKFHEIYPPVGMDLVLMADGAFKKEELIRMEEKICDTLDYDLTQKTAFEYLERFTDIAIDGISPTAHKELEVHLATCPESMDVTRTVKHGKRIKFLARYALERYNLCAHSVGRPAKHMAAMALYTALSLTSHSWTPDLAKVSGFTKQDLRDPNFAGGPFRNYKCVLVNYGQDSHSAVIHKYKVPQLGQVSTLRKRRA